MATALCGTVISGPANRRSQWELRAPSKVTRSAKLNRTASDVATSPVPSEVTRARASPGVARKSAAGSRDGTTNPSGGNTPKAGAATPMMPAITGSAVVSARIPAKM